VCAILLDNALFAPQYVAVVDKFFGRRTIDDISVIMQLSYP